MDGNAKKKKELTIKILVDEKEIILAHRITKIKVKPTSQEESQEIECQAVSLVVNEKYVKPPPVPRSESGQLFICDTPDENNEWADCAHTLKTNDTLLRNRDRGPTQQALCDIFLPTIGKTPDDELVEEDWPKLVNYVEAFGKQGCQLIKGREEYVKDGKVVPKVQERRIVYYKKLICFVRPRGHLCETFITKTTQLTREPICTFPNCLAVKGVLQDYLRCKIHQGVRKYGVCSLVTESGTKKSFFFTIFAFSVKKNATEDEVDKQFRDNANASKCSQFRVDATVDFCHRAISETAKEAEQYYATLQTAFLLAKLGGAKSDGKEIELLNTNTVFAYKCERKMAQFLKDEFNMVITGDLFPGHHALPSHLGTLVGDGESGGDRYVYMEYDDSVNYTGKRKKDIESVIRIRAALHSQKTKSSCPGIYEDTMTKEHPERGVKYRLKKKAVITNKRDLLEMTEDVTNFGNYIAHCFKVDHPITGLQFIALNKQIQTKHMLSNWINFKGLMRALFKVEINLRSTLASLVKTPHAIKPVPKSARLIIQPPPDPAVPEGDPAVGGAGAVGSGHEKEEKINTKTKEKPPGCPSEPDNIKVIKRNGGVLIEWDRPQFTDGVIKGYTVYLAVKAEYLPPNVDRRDYTTYGFELMHSGIETNCFIPKTSLDKAMIVEQNNQTAIVFRIAAKNVTGFGAPVKVSWLQEAAVSTSVKRGVSSTQEHQPAKKGKKK